MKTIYVLLPVILFFATSCSWMKKPKEVQKEEPCQEQAPMDDRREDILIVGDSISIGYTPTIRENFPQYEVVHNPCNGRTSVKGLAYLEEWASLRPRWKLITLNHGLWDIVPFYEVSHRDYKAALKIIGKKYLSVADHVIFFTTTYVPPGTENRNNQDVIIYNEVAKDVMKELGIPVYDLYATSLQIPNEHLAPNDVHFTPKGYEHLGKAVTAAIRTELKAK